MGYDRDSIARAKRWVTVFNRWSFLPEAFNPVVKQDGDGHTLTVSNRIAIYEEEGSPSEPVSVIYGEPSGKLSFIFMDDPPILGWGTYEFKVIRKEETADVLTFLSSYAMDAEFIVTLPLLEIPPFATIDICEKCAELIPGVVRLPLADSAGAFLCKRCWVAEMKFRKARNKELHSADQMEIFPFPSGVAHQI